MEASNLSRAIEAAQKLLIVFVGSGCKKCGDKNKYTSSGRCVTCNKAKTKEQTKKHKLALRNARNMGIQATKGGK